MLGVDRVHGAIGTERGVLDVEGDGIEVPGLEIEGEQLSLARPHVEDFRLGIEADDVLDDRDAPSQRTGDFGKAGETIQPGGAALGGETDSNTRAPSPRPSRLANYMRGLGLG